MRWVRSTYPTMLSVAASSVSLSRDARLFPYARSGIGGTTTLRSPGVPLSA